MKVLNRLLSIMQMVLGVSLVVNSRLLVVTLWRLVLVVRWLCLVGLSEWY